MEIKIHQDFIRTDGEEVVSKYIDDLLADKIVVVEENKKYIGVLTRRSILKWKLEPSNAKIKNFIYKIPLMKTKKIEETISLIEYILKYNTRFVLIGSNNKVKGYIWWDDIIKENIEKIKDKKVNEIMQTEVPIIDEDEPLSKAFYLIKHYQVDRLIIIDKKHNVSGILTLTDIIRFIIKPFKKPTKGEKKGEKVSLLKKPVREFMNDNPIVIIPNTSLKEAFEIMEKTNINSLIVVKGKNQYSPIGLLTKRDILLYLKGLLEKEEEYKITFTLHNVELDELDKEWIKNKIKKLLKKFKKILNNYDVHIDIKKIKEHYEEEIDKYLVKIHLIIPGKMFLVNSENQSMVFALNQAFKILERQLLKYKEEHSEKEIYKFIKELESYW